MKPSSKAYVAGILKIHGFILLSILILMLFPSLVDSLSCFTVNISLRIKAWRLKWLSMWPASLKCKMECKRSSVSQHSCLWLGVCIPTKSMWWTLTSVWWTDGPQYNDGLFMIAFFMRVWVVFIQWKLTRYCQVALFMATDTLWSPLVMQDSGSLSAT